VCDVTDSDISTPSTHAVIHPVLELYPTINGHDPLEGCAEQSAFTTATCHCQDWRGQLEDLRRGHYLSAGAPPDPLAGGEGACCTLQGRSVGWLGLTVFSAQRLYHAKNVLFTMFISDS